MSLNISLDEPFLEQQSVREILNLSAEKTNLNLNSEDLIKLACYIIRTKLVECDCDENELQDLRLEQIVSKSLKVQTEEDSDGKILDGQKRDTPDARDILKPVLPLPIEFLIDLRDRLNETTATSSSDVNLDLLLKFKSSPVFVLSKGGCCGNVRCSDGKPCVETSKEPSA